MFGSVLLLRSLAAKKTFGATVCTEPSLGFSTRFWLTLLTTRIRSITGLKSKPKFEPLRAEVSTGPICVATPVAVLMPYNRFMLPRAYNRPLAGRKSMPRMTSLGCRPLSAIPLRRAFGAALSQVTSVCDWETPKTSSAEAEDAVMPTPATTAAVTIAVFPR